MPVHDDLGTRMKAFYEQIPKTKLMRRCPVIIRCDGKAFHTFTKGFGKPFDNVLIDTMQRTAKYLCENIQGCVLGYVQSDEISLVLVDYDRIETSAWFDYEVQKLCSVAASMATMAFNKLFKEFVTNTFYTSSSEIYSKKFDHAMFDARAFNIPKEEVANYIYWRQLDAIRNSIQMVGQANFSHKQLQNKTCNNIKTMLVEQKGIDWDTLPIHLKRGSCVIKEKYWADDNGNKVFNVGKDSKEILNRRSHWIIDGEIPIFKGEDRDYIDNLVMISV